MLRIKLTTAFPEWLLARQTPCRSGVWEDCRFLINEAVEACDFWVVYEGMPDLVMENSQQPDYWTEKLADAYLGRAYPLYFGCPNLADYFSEDAFTPVDITRPQAALESIAEALRTNLYERRLAAIEAARQLVLERYNLFPMLTELCRATHTSRCQPSMVVLRPESDFRRSSKTRRLLRRMRRGF